MAIFKWFVICDPYLNQSSKASFFFFFFENTEEKRKKKKQKTKSRTTVPNPFKQTDSPPIFFSGLVIGGRPTLSPLFLFFHLLFSFSFHHLVLSLFLTKVIIPFLVFKAQCCEIYFIVPTILLRPTFNYPHSFMS